LQNTSSSLEPIDEVDSSSILSDSQLFKSSCISVLELLELHEESSESSLLVKIVL